jgi:hypothetical protein
VPGGNTAITILNLDLTECAVDEMVRELLYNIHKTGKKAMMSRII